MNIKQYSKIDWSDFQQQLTIPIERKMQYIDIELPVLQREDKSICINGAIQETDI